MASGGYLPNSSTSYTTNLCSEKLGYLTQYISYSCVVKNTIQKSPYSSVDLQSIV